MSRLATLLMIGPLLCTSCSSETQSRRHAQEKQNIDTAFGLNNQAISFEWQRSLPIGSLDPDGHLIGGTEIRALSSFDGKLFAANGYWTDKFKRQSWLPGAQVFRLDKPLQDGGTWTVDLQLDERVDQDDPTTGTSMRRYHTISAMETITFRTDKNGNSLPEPVTLLIVGVWERKNALTVFTRDTSGPASWQKSVIKDVRPETGSWHVRTFKVHRDKETGVDLLFVGTSGRGSNRRSVFRAGYDREVEGRLIWENEAEPWDRVPGKFDRVMSLAVANGSLYATVCGNVYEREDGKNPLWHLRFRHPRGRCPEEPGEWSFRGATSITEANGKESLLMAMEGTALLGRMTFGDQMRWRPELRLRPFLRRGLHRETISYTIAAYNGFAPFKQRDGQTIHFVGIETLIYPGAPNTWYNGWQRGAWFITRHPTGAFTLHRIPGEKGEGAMVATRAMIASPFPGETDVIYAGGFDANHVQGVNHNTGWLYRGVVRTAP